MGRMKQNQKGITLLILVVTVIILLIIAGIGIYSGMDSIKNVKLEELKTNMLLIEAKAREYVEDASFKIGKETDEIKIEQIKKEVYETNGKLRKASDIGLTGIDKSIPIEKCYVITKETLEDWGLNKIELDESKNEKYLLEFNEAEIEVEIYNTKGYEGKYSLKNLEK